MNIPSASGVLRLGWPSLERLPRSVRRPALPQGAGSVGIVHLGVGNFHRAHQAVYTEAVLADDPGWAIAGVSLRRPDMHLALAPQQGLYTLIERSAGQAPSVAVIGALRSVLVAPREPRAVTALLADPSVRIVSLTITEKAYCRDAHGGLDLADPLVRADVAAPRTPTGALGYLVEAARQRREAGRPGFTVLSCDNLSGNGSITRELLLQHALASFAGEPQAARDLAAWIDAEMSFPNGMVDRIVPHTTDELRAQVGELLGVEDAAPVATESFTQWVLEDRFAAGRPHWERAGVQFVDDVAPYEAMKLRLLNAAHSAIAYLAVPAGWATVDQAIARPELRHLIETFWRDEAVPCLPAGAASGAGEYCSALMTRFQNPALAHRTDQIAMDGSQKLPLRLLPTVAACLATHRPCSRSALILAAWIRFLGGRTDDGRVYTIQDPQRDGLVEALRRAGPSAADRVAAMLAMPGLTGAGFSAGPGLIDAITRHLAGLDRLGTLGWLRQQATRQGGGT